MKASRRGVDVAFSVVGAVVALALMGAGARGMVRRLREVSRVDAGEASSAGDRADDHVPLFAGSGQTYGAAESCAVLEKENEARVARVRASLPWADAGLPPAKDPHEILPTLADTAFHACVPTPHGAWAVALDAILVPGGKADTTRDRNLLAFDSVARVIVLHGGEGAEAWTMPETWELTSFGDHFELGEGNVKIEDGCHAELSLGPDFDGDGEPEAVTRFVCEQPSAARVDHAVVNIWTFAPDAAPDRRVQLYRPARGAEIRRLEDVDHDGRMDLVEARFAHPMAGCDRINWHNRAPDDLIGPETVAHARADGSFATDDEAARAFDMSKCPNVGIAGMAPPKNQVDAVEMYNRLACARIAGAPLADLRKQVAAVCGSEFSSEEPSDDACEDDKRLRCPIWLFGFGVPSRWPGDRG